MNTVVDPLDPRLLDFGDEHEYRIYGDDRAQTWAVVDEEDYHYFVRWRWNWKCSYPGRRTPKFYLRRAVEICWKPRTVITKYLHIEIMKRVRPEPPTPAHCIVDHRDGDSTNCRRSNLRWATHRLNALNVRGGYCYGELL